jgi:hypothetical protein
LVLLVGLSLSCEHTTPFRPDVYTPDGPLAPGAITRLTYNPGQDVEPTWSAGGDTIVYTAERLDRPDHDRCLAFMPGRGGSVAHYRCRTSAADDSLDVFEDATFGAGDSLAYMRASSNLALPPLAPETITLVAGTRSVWSLPFTATWGTTYDALSHVAWLGSTRVAAIGERVTFPRPCRTCAVDTVRTGLDVLILDFGGATTALTRLTGADSASSLAVSANRDTLYFTRDGDSRVYRHLLGGGQIDTLLDFGIGIARDIAVSSGKLVAVVGGAVSYSVDSILGGSQPDHGGALYLVSGGGAPAQIGDPAWLFRRPALSPDGTSMVVAARNGAATADIWLFQLP